jgi:hypothetical protein
VCRIVKLSQRFAILLGEKEARMTDQINPQQFHKSEGVAD